MAKDDKTDISTKYLSIFPNMNNKETLVKEITTLELKVERLVNEIRELQKKEKDNKRWLKN